MTGNRFALVGKLAGAVVAAVLTAAFFSGTSDAARQPVPEPKIDAPRTGGLQTAVFAGGCFWGVEAVFEHVKGVTNAVSGYAGGKPANPSYEDVSSGTTGHAESVRVTWDPKQVSYGTLLKVFFEVAHDPTTLNRQGPDHGTQYRSAIFYRSPEQQKVAESYVAQLTAAHAFKDPIVTQIAPLPAFYRAEEYHQDYFTKNRYTPYIVINDAPKVAAL